jgi:predicted DNA-binding transcriptional regulator AlpA
VSATDRYVTVSWIVERLGVTRQTLARWCAEGTFCTPYYFGRAKRFLLADVEQWEAEHRGPPPDVAPPAAPAPESGADAGSCAP